MQNHGKKMQHLEHEKTYLFYILVSADTDTDAPWTKNMIVGDDGIKIEVVKALCK